MGGHPAPRQGTTVPCTPAQEWEYVRMIEPGNSFSLTLEEAYSILCGAVVRVRRGAPHVFAKGISPTVFKIGLPVVGGAHAGDSDPNSTVWGGPV